MADDVEERMEAAGAGQSLRFLSPVPQSENAKTRQATNYGIRLFREYGARHGYPNIFDLPERDVARLLKGFYGAVRTKDGQRFSVNSLIAIRYAISRYYRSPQARRKIDIVKDPNFDEANEAFRTILRDLDRDAGRIVPCQKDIVDADDRRKLRYYFEHAISTPRGLLQKVWYDLMLHLGRRGRDGQRMLRKDSFQIVQDRDGRRYVYLNEEEEGGGVEVIMEKPGDQLCPVRTFAIYLSRLNPACEALFQRPKDRITKQDVFWYVNSAIGKNMLATMMSTISKCAGLSRVYTNLRVRATAYGGNSLVPNVPVAGSSIDSGDARGDSESDEMSVENGPSLRQLVLASNPQLILTEGPASQYSCNKSGQLLPSSTVIENSFSSEVKNQTSMQGVGSNSSKSCLQCGTAATLQFSSQGVSQVFCSVSCFQAFTCKGKGEQDGQQNSGSKCISCGQEMKSQGGFLLTAEKIGKKLFCSTVCLAQWVSKDQGAQGQQDGSNSSISGHCDYCLSKRPVKRQFLGNNGILHQFCSDECMTCYQTLMMNGLVPSQSGNSLAVNGGGRQSNTTTIDSVTSSVMSLAAVTRKLGMNFGDAANQASIHSDSRDEIGATSRTGKMPSLLQLQLASKSLPISKRDQGVSCKPSMVSVGILCKPANLAKKNVAGQGRTEDLKQTSETFNNFPLTNGLINGIAVPINCAFADDVSGKPTSEQELEATKCEAMDEENGEDADDEGDDEDDGGPLSLEVEVCLEEGMGSNGAPSLWTFEGMNGSQAKSPFMNGVSREPYTPFIPTEVRPGIYDFPQRRLGRTTKRFSWEEIAERSKSQTMWAVKLFRDWLSTNYRPPDFENLRAEDLANELHDFYEGLVKPDGEDYSVSTLNSVRASINRYLTLPPHSKPFSIIFSREFRRANESFFSRVRAIQQINLSTTFTSDDMHKIMSSEALSSNHPNGLLRKVWFCLVLILGGKHGTIFPLLTKDCFRITQDEKGLKVLIFHFAPAFLPNGSEIKVKVRKSGSRLCPVTAVELYLARLSAQCDAFFQTPNHPFISQVSDPWFLPRPLPDTRLKGMMKEISSAGGLSRIYSNQALHSMAANQYTANGSNELLSVAGLTQAIMEH